MKKILCFSATILLMLCVIGCGKEETKVNSESKLAAAKTNMITKLENYSYDVEMTTKTGIFDVTTTMNCKEDRKNMISHCITSTLGIETEDYIDYTNKINYSKVTVPFGGDENNGKWTSIKYSGENTNSWMNLNDFIFNLTEEKKDGGTYYIGTIDSRKLASAMAEADSDVDTKEVVSDDINIGVFVNKAGYIENMSFTMEIMGIEEVVEITYKDFNSSGELSIPAEVK